MDIPISGERSISCNSYKIHDPILMGPSKKPIALGRLSGPYKIRVFGLVFNNSAWLA